MHRARSMPVPSTLRSPWLLLLVLLGARGSEAYFAKDSDDYRTVAAAAVAGGALQAAQTPAQRSQLPPDLEEYANLMLLLREYLIKEAARYQDQAAGKTRYGDPVEAQNIVSKRGGGNPSMHLKSTM
ncbi:unnamed protein product [Ixodes persulcatus]